MRRLAEGAGWQVAEYVCTAGPGDPVFEERHPAFTVSAVLEGVFDYRGDAGSALLHPGALMLGNHGACYECGHSHGTGDRCVALHFAPERFREIAASMAGGSAFRFPRGGMAIPEGVGPLLAGIEGRIAADGPLLAEELVTGLVGQVLRVLSGEPPRRQQVSARDAGRIARALDYIRTHGDDGLDLDALAGAAAMSRFHFLRTFRAVTGRTPWQHVLERRLNRAAVRLVADAEPVAAIAFDCGFGDLSTFNARFRRHYGMTPTAYRQRERGVTPSRAPSSRGSRMAPAAAGEPSPPAAR
ncbi:MAG: AraC family transcriptional regulator [Pseudomonadota bacterium]|nr:AraC family transcriptional regulator [Pseudomonadota bacterium]